MSLGCKQWSKTSDFFLFFIFISAVAEELSKHMKVVIVICFLFAEHQFGGISAKQQMPLSNYLETDVACQGYKQGILAKEYIFVIDCAY